MSKHCNERELLFAKTYVATRSIIKAGAAIELKNPQQSAGSWLKRKPHLKELIDKMIVKADEKTIEKVTTQIANNTALSLELADKRLEELLTSKRMDEELISVMSNLGRTKAGIEMIKEQGMAEGLGGNKISDVALLRAIDLAYKRRDGYPKAATAQQLNLQQFIQQGVVSRAQGEVYEPAWIREQYGSTNAIDAELERGLELNSAPATMGTEDEGSGSLT